MNSQENQNTTVVTKFHHAQLLDNEVPKFVDQAYEASGGARPVPVATQDNSVVVAMSRLAREGQRRIGTIQLKCQMFLLGLTSCSVDTAKEKEDVDQDVYIVRTLEFQRRLINGQWKQIEVPIVRLVAKTKEGSIPFRPSIIRTKTDSLMVAPTRIQTSVDGQNFRTGDNIIALAGCQSEAELKKVVLHGSMASYSEEDKKNAWAIVKAHAQVNDDGIWFWHSILSSDGNIEGVLNTIYVSLKDAEIDGEAFLPYRNARVDTATPALPALDTVLKSGGDEGEPFASADPGVEDQTVVNSLAELVV